MKDIRSNVGVEQPVFPVFCKLAMAREKGGVTTSSGIALVCGRRTKGNAPREDRWEDVLTVPVSTEFVVDLVRWGGLDASMPEESQRRAEFMSLLALHPDARLRAAAACEKGLADSSLMSLLKDSSHEVRCNLSLNLDAVGRLSPQQAIALADEDGQILENVMDSMVDALYQSSTELLKWKKICPKNEQELNFVNALPKTIACLQEKVRVLLSACWEHPDLSVRQQTRLLDHRLKQLEEVCPQRVKRPPFVRKSASAFGLNLYGRSQDYVYALSFMKSDESTGELIPDRQLSMLMIPIDGLDTVSKSLPVGLETDAVMIRLAQHPSREVRTAVAGRDGLPSAAIDCLKHDKSFDVREALLGNEAVLTELADKDILRLLADDPGLLESAFAYGCPSERIGRLLTDHFSDSPDPYVAETLATISD